MVQSMQPNTTHGSELKELFCFDFDRPNCLGSDLAASHLIKYSEEFLRCYERRRKREDPSLRWAAFVHFIDTHEDTMVLSSLLDGQLSSFLERIGESEVLDSSLVVLTSDHGLHYGPYFQSRSGRREATEPLLYVHAPPSIDADGLRRNAENSMWITPFDLHETMLAVALPPDMTVGIRKGVSLLSQLPGTRKTCLTTNEIPSEYCVLKQENVVATNDPNQMCSKMARPPNVLSFYGDLPVSKRNHFPLDCRLVGNKTASQASPSRRCQCATSHREWYRCTEHPWGNEGAQSKSSPHEYFALVKCRDQKLAIDTRVNSGKVFHDIQRRQLDTSTKTLKSRPNILFVEIDSASTAYAERHLQHTRKFLQRFKLRQSQDGQIECNDGICAAEFNLFSVNGPNSIANQVSVLR